MKLTFSAVVQIRFGVDGFCGVLRCRILGERKGVRVSSSWVVLVKSLNLGGRSWWERGGREGKESSRPSNGHRRAALDFPQHPSSLLSFLQNEHPGRPSSIPTSPPPPSRDQGAHPTLLRTLDARKHLPSLARFPGALLPHPLPRHRDRRTGERRETVLLEGKHLLLVLKSLRVLCREESEALSAELELTPPSLLLWIMFAFLSFSAPIT